MRRISLLLLSVLLFPALAAGAAKDTKLALVAYSTPRAAYGKLIPAFQKTAAGKDVSFSESYGASGEQSRAVAAGLPADIVALSLEPDVVSLVQKGIVARGWNTNKWKGMVTRSVVVFVLRDGNPKRIHSWDDLVKPGVQIVTPNPATSGGAKWNVMAGYGSQIRAGEKPAQANAYLRRFFSHVVASPSSAREALQTFLSGRGDVLLSYENEAIFAQQSGQNVQFLIPKATILIENPIAVTSKSTHKTEANAFLTFLHSAAGQRIFAENGYRPVLSSAARGLKFPKRPQLFTIKYLGGWAKVDPRFFDPNNGIVTKIQRSLGG